MWYNCVMRYENKNGLCVIYKATLPNGCCYVGQSWEFVKRRKRHERGYDDSVFSRAIKKYGKENVVWDIIAEVGEQTTADYFEKYYINAFNALLDGDGYNIEKGGACGKWCAAARMRVSGENSPFYGVKRSASTRRKQSAAQSGSKNSNYGKRASAATRRKQSLSHCGEKNGMFGRKRTEEEKLKVSVANRGRKRTTEQRKRMSIGQKKRFARENNQRKNALIVV